ncbi:hypothetical protein A3770_13p70200 [Chloropicon primus]|uniref:Uncharacterized protein n=1 Tax=Chloropicon primus TaxID=1764295 RepID=A0A5B8MY55_9CHLO|nr:hypothetical protein A3770_13p70200 [Chloropicon primus]|eukprot:QDZ24502.1 hypothetical protein A3770_13p70200 [Chloropicon primus]
MIGNKITSLAIIAALCAAGVSATDELEHEWKNHASAKAEGKSTSRTGPIILRRRGRGGRMRRPILPLYDAVADTTSHADADCYGEDCGAAAEAISTAFADDGWGTSAMSLSMSDAAAVIEDTVSDAVAGVVEDSQVSGPRGRASAHGTAYGDAYSYLWKKDHGDTPVDPTPPPPEHHWSDYPKWGYKPKWGWAHAGDK